MAEKLWLRDRLPVLLAGASSALKVGIGGGSMPSVGRRLMKCQYCNVVALIVFSCDDIQTRESVLSAASCRDRLLGGGLAKLSGKRLVSCNH